MKPRAMNNEEKAGLKVVKDSGLAFEVKYDYSPYSGGYTVDVPALIGTYSLRHASFFSEELKRYQSGNKQSAGQLRMGL